MEFVTVPAALSVLIFGIVEFTKKLGLEGKQLTIASFAVAFILAVVYQLPEMFPAAAQWIQLFFFGLAGALSACGLYDFVNKRVPKQP